MHRATMDRATVFRAVDLSIAGVLCHDVLEGRGIEPPRTHRTTRQGRPRQVDRLK